MKRVICLVAALCLLLTGCDWMRGNYYEISPHQEQVHTGDTGEVTAANYSQLEHALEQMVLGGKEKGIIYVPEYRSAQVEEGIIQAVHHILFHMPLGAYAVEDIVYEVGTNGGIPAISVEISYLHGRSEMRQILDVENMEQTTQAICAALESCEPAVVMQVSAYAPLDIPQLVQNYALQHPELVMEIPQVTVGIYPDNGSIRILEVRFTYQNSRDTLQQMQTQVASLFDAADLYVAGNTSDFQKLSRMYGFIAGLGFDLQLDTSITPAYSLLRHGVGDSKAVATVFAAMCRRSGMDCQVVTGTRNGEPWYWNVVRDTGRYCHVDLVRCWELGGFREFSDSEMHGYVWDYSAYPVCPDIVPEPSEETSEPEESDTTENF